MLARDRPLTKRGMEDQTRKEAKKMGEERFETVCNEIVYK